MPSVYLSPSTQEYNPTVGGGTEEYYANLVADAIEPYLTASGISFSRNTPDMTASTSTAQSNQGNYDLHFAIHSNASPESLMGKQSGADFYYYTSSTSGKRAADIMVENYKEIYPNPTKVRALPNSTFVELRRTRAPAVLGELVYHDNESDMNWYKNNIPEIGRNLAQSIAEFLGVPFKEPAGGSSGNSTGNNGTSGNNGSNGSNSNGTGTAAKPGVVVTQGGRLNIRDEPFIQGRIIGQIPNNTEVSVLDTQGCWYKVLYNGITGYVFKDYISIQ